MDIIVKLCLQNFPNQGHSNIKPIHFIEFPFCLQKNGSGFLTQEIATFLLVYT